MKRASRDEVALPADEHRTSNIEHPTSNGGRASGEGAGWFDLEERLLEYSARIIRLADALLDTRAGTPETDQLIRIFVASLRKAAERAKDGKVREEEPFSPSMFGVGSWMFDVQPPAGPSHSGGVSYLPKPRPSLRK